MSNELILEMKCEYEEAIVGITGVQDALVSFERTVELTTLTLNEFSSAEDTLTSQIEKFEKAMGVSYAAMFDLQEETEILTKVIKENGAAFEHSEVKSSLMKKVLQEQMDKYIEFGHVVPKSLKEVADKYDVLSTSEVKANKAGEETITKLKEGFKEIDEGIQSFFTTLKHIGEQTPLEGLFSGLQKGAEYVKGAVERMFGLAEGIEKIKTTVGPAIKSLGSLKGALKSIPTSMKISIGLMGLDLAIKGVNWIFSELREAQDKRFEEIEKDAEKSAKAFQTIQYVYQAIREKGGTAYREFMEDMRKSNAELRKAGKDSGEILTITAEKLKPLRESIEKTKAAEVKLAKAVEETSTCYGIYTGKYLTELQDKQKTMIGVWAQHKNGIISNADSTKSYLADLIKLKDQLGNEVDPKLNGIIASLERANEQFERKEAIDNFSKSLGFLKQADIVKDLDLMAISLKENAEQYQKNPELIEPLLKKIEELKVKARQTGAEMSTEFKELEKQEAELKNLKTAYDTAANSIHIFGITIPIDELRKMAEETKKNEEAVQAYAESLGYISKQKVKDEIDKITQSLSQNADQLKNNPEYVKNMLVKMNELEEKSKKTGEGLSDAFKEGKEAVENAYNATKVLNVEQQLLADILGMSNVEYMDFSETTKEIGASLSDIGGHGKEVLGFLTDTGLVSGETAKALGSLVNGVSQVGAGFTELATNPIGGAMKILGGAVDFVSGLFSLFSGDEVGDAIDKERKFIDISDEMEEKIRKLEESIGDTHAATSLLMDEIIKEADINANNFDNYVKRTHDILSDLDRGKISMQEAQESIGKSFNELINKAQKLGTEGSKEMISMMRDLRARGMEVAEVQEYVNQQLQSGIEAFGNYLDTFTGSTEEIKKNFKSMGTYALGLFHSLVEEGATFMEAMQAMGDQLTKLAQIAQDNELEVSGALKELLDMQTFINQNKELVDRISATTKMLEALGNTGYLTAEIFNQFQRDAQSQFETLMERTGDAKQAYQLLAPELAKMAWYATQYGYQLDDNTKKMIAEAQQHGINMNAMIPAEEKMVALMEELVTVLGGKIPYAMDRMADAANRAFGRMRDSAGEFNREAQRLQYVNIDQNSGGRAVGGPPVGAAAGYSGWVTKPTSFLIGEGGEPEFVSVIPRSRMYVYPVNDERYNSKDGDIVFEHITIYSENGEEAVREFMTAVKNNKYGVQNLIRKVVQ